MTVFENFVPKSTGAPASATLKEIPLNLAQSKLENGDYKGSECAQEISNLYDLLIESYFKYLIGLNDIAQNKTDFEKIAIFIPFYC